jgi:hypothetical protein
MNMGLENLTEPELKVLFDSIGHAVRSRLPKQTFYAVLVFDNSGVGQYVSNAKRADMVKAMRETADRLERLEDVSR